MSDSIDRGKIMAFINGEMNEAESRVFLELVAQDEKLRAELEDMRRTSQSLQAHFGVKGGDEKLSAAQLAKIRAKAAPEKAKGLPWWIFAGGFVAAGLAVVLTVTVFRAPEKTPVEISETTPAPLDEDMMQEIGNGEPTDETLAELAGANSSQPEMKAEELATPEEQKAFSEGKGFGAAAGGIGAQAKLGGSVTEDTTATSEAVDDAPVAKKMKSSKVSAMTRQLKTKAADATHHFTYVVESKATISPNLSKGAVLTLAKQMFDGDDTCVPVSVKLSGFSLIIEISRDGGFTSVKTEPVLPETAAITECMRQKLQDSPYVFAPSDKGPARVKLPFELR